ncbi:hypothetical protein QTN47_01305 [Danxiaibacter flavus]|uniref:Lipoprotein n=1 Tax=Danxiaibacter flavus TaxID=3049108 RepID=A0ABV3Z8C0_9BACT|nr:hypothetical protein QNM32_01305 [Chitinophagaceae bacterium DXS]
MFRKIFLAAALMCLVFASCLDTEEKISLNADNSGTYQLNMDMSKMLEQMKAFMPQSDSLFPADEQDRVVPLVQLIDSASAQQQALFKEGTMLVHSNKDSNELSLTFVVPFKNTDDLAAIKKHLFELVDVKKISEGMAGAGGIGDEAVKGMAIIAPTSTGFTFTAGKHEISNQLSQRSSLDSLLSDQSVQQFRMLSFMGGINYKTVLELPSPVKNYKGQAANISDDKKTVTFTNTLNELFDTPDAFEYKVDW